MYNFLRSLETNRIAVIKDNGISTFNHVPPGEYEVFIRETNNPSANKMDEEFLYLKPNATSILDDKYIIKVLRDMPTQTLNWKKYPNRAWRGHYRDMQECIKEHNGEYINYDTITPTINLPGVGNSWEYMAGSVMLEDGKILKIPYRATNYTLYDPVSNTYENVGPTYEPAANLHGRGVLLHDGKVLLVPYQVGDSYWGPHVPYYNKYYKIFDPVSKTVDKVGNSIWEGSGSGPDSECMNSTHLPDGRILVVGYRIRPFDYEREAGKWTNYEIDRMYFMHVLDPINYIGYSLQNGYVVINDSIGYGRRACQLSPVTGRVMTGFSGNNTVGPFEMINPNNNFQYTIFAVDGTYNGVSLTENDGEMIFPRLVWHNVIKFKESTMLFKQMPNFTVNTTHSSGYSGCTLLPDGRIFFNSIENHPAIYNPRTNDLQVINYDYPSVQSNLLNEKFNASRLLPDGRICLIPGSLPYGLIISASDGNYGRLPKIGTLLSTYFNKN